MDLKFTEQTFKVVKSFDLEKLIQDTFNIKEYNLVSAEEERNDTVWTCRINNDPVDAYHLKAIQEWLKTGSEPSFMTRHIMQHMCNMGKLDPGDYLVEISW